MEIPDSPTVGGVTFSGCQNAAQTGSIVSIQIWVLKLSKAIESLEIGYNYGEKINYDALGIDI